MYLNLKHMSTRNLSDIHYYIILKILRVLDIKFIKIKSVLINILPKDNNLFWVSM